MTGMSPAAFFLNPAASLLPIYLELENAVAGEWTSDPLQLTVSL